MTVFMNPRIVRADTMPADAPEVAVAIVGAGACGLTTAIRLRQAGFASCIDTEECIVQHLQAMQAQGYLPR